jgi:hypothetical protein
MSLVTRNSIMTASLWGNSLMAWILFINIPATNNNN